MRRLIDTLPNVTTKDVLAIAIAMYVSLLIALADLWLMIHHMVRHTRQVESAVEYAVNLYLEDRPDDTTAAELREMLTSSAPTPAPTTPAPAPRSRRLPFGL